MELAVRNPVTWIVYCAIYVVSFAGLAAFLWLGLEPRQPANLIDYLAKVSGGSIGVALFAALSWEVIRAMVLLAPMLKRWIEERARQEGFAEGEERGQKAERQRWQSWLRRRNEAEANNQPFDEPPPSEAE